MEKRKAKKAKKAAKVKGVKHVLSRKHVLHLKVPKKTVPVIVPISPTEIKIAADSPEALKIRQETYRN